MEQIVCPHCGASLPVVVDAFCPECRERLDEPPAPAGPAAAPERGEAPRDRRGLWLLLAGFGALFVGVMDLALGGLTVALYAGGVGVFLIVAGLVWLERRAE